MQKTKALVSEYKAVSHNLCPRVDHRWNLERVNRQLQHKSGGNLALVNSLPHTVWADHLACYVLCPTAGNELRGVLQSDSDRWGVSFEQVFADALKNSYAESPPNFSSLVSAKNVYELHESMWNEGDHAARLMLPAMNELPVPGERLLFPISNNKVMITGSNSSVGLSAVLDKLALARRSPDSLPPVALTQKGKQFATWYRLFLTLITPVSKDYWICIRTEYTASSAISCGQHMLAITTFASPNSCCARIAERIYAARQQFSRVFTRRLCPELTTLYSSR